MPMSWRTRIGAAVIVVMLMAAALLAANSLTQRDSDELAPTRYWHELPPERSIADDSVAASQQTTHTAPRIRFEPETLDLGMTMKGAERTASIRLVNPTASAILIESVSSDCGCVSIEPVSIVEIAPESEVEIPIRFKAPGRAGRIRHSEINARLAGGDVITASVTSRIVDAVAVVDPEVAAPLRQDTGTSVVSMDRASFKLIRAEPTVLEFDLGSESTEHEVVVDSERWNLAERPQAIVLHTTHATTPSVVIRVAVSKTRSGAPDHRTTDSK